MANRQDGGFLRDSTGALVVSGAGSTRSYLGAPAQLVAARPANPGAYASSGAVNTTFMSRLRHVAAVDCAQVRLVYANWDNGEVVGSNSVPIKCSVEKADGTIIPVSFNGVRTPTLEAGFTIVSDPVGIELKKGDVLWSRTFVVVSAGSGVPYNYGANASTGEAGIAGAPGGVTDKADSGTITAASGSAYGPSAIIGLASGTVPSVTIIGDSVAQGFGDNVTNDLGFIVRALSVSPFAWVGVAHSGETAQTYAATATSYRRRQLTAMAKYAVVEYGTNDAFAGRTLAQMQADLLTIWTQLVANGQTVYQTTLTPRTTSTDSWVTLANQTVAGVAGQDTNRALVNNWVRAGSPIDPTTKAAVAVGTSGALLAGVTGHPLTGYFEVADVVESARDSGIWKVPGAVGTGDLTLSSAVVANVNTTGGTFAVGQGLVGTGVPAATSIISVGAGTFTMSNVASATNTGVALTTRHTADGVHPTPGMHTTMSAVVDTTKFV